MYGETFRATTRHNHKSSDMQSKKISNNQELIQSDPISCDVSSLSDLLRAVRTDEIVTFSADGYGSYWQIIYNVWQILSPSKSVDVSVST